MSALGGPRRTLKQLLIQGYNEIPEVIFGTLLALSAVPFGMYGVYDYYRRDLDNRKYKNTYIVMRPDDPRVAKVHKDTDPCED